MPARIPVYDTPQVEAHGYSNPGPQLSNDNSGAAVTRGFDELGQAADKYQQHMDKAAAEAKAKANAISQANADAAYQNAETAKLVGGTNRGQLIDNAFNETGDGTDVGPGDVQATPGFLDTRGMDAAKQSGPVLDDLEKTRQQIAETNFSDEEERQKWLARSAGMYADTNRKVQAHTAQQFQVAQEDAVKGQLASGLQAIPSITDPAQVADIGHRGEASLRALNPPGPAVDAAVGKWWSDVSATHIVNGLLGAGDVAGARAAYNGAKGILGTQADDVERAIVHAEQAQAIGQAKIAGATAANTEIQKAIDQKSGWIDAAKANAGIAALPPGPAKDHALEYGKAQIAVLEKAKAEAVHQHFAAALSALEKTNGNLNAIADEDTQFLQSPLNKLDGEETWQKLLIVADRYKTRFRESTKAHAEHETPAQAQALVELKANIAAHPEVYRGMSAAQLAHDWADKLSVGGYKQAGNAFATAQKDDPIKAGDFAQFVKETTVAAPSIANNKVEAAKYAARMGALRQEYVDEHKKEPDLKARKEMQAAATQEVVLATHWYGDKKGPAFKAPLTPTSPRPAAKTPDQQALDWANANPADPRSAAIKKKLGVQ